MLQKQMSWPSELGREPTSTRHPMAEPYSAELGPRERDQDRVRSGWRGAGREWKQE